MAQTVTASERSESRACPEPVEGNLAVVVVALLCVFASRCALAAAPPDPSVRLYDTGGAVAGDPATESNWVQVPQADLSYTFKDRPVLKNDKLAVFLFKNGPGAGVRAELPHGQVSAIFLGLQATAEGASTIKIIENNPGAVELEKSGKAKGGRQTRCRYRLTAGEPFVEVRPGEGMGQIDISGFFRHVVVPEFFGDDIVLGEALEEGLPAENFFVVLLDSGESLATCVWESEHQHAHLRALMQMETVEVKDASKQPPAPETVRFSAGECRIECLPGKRIWIGLVQDPGLWHRRYVADGDKATAVLRNFRPPFPAKWRASFVGAGGVCESITFEQPPEKAPVPDDWRGPVIIYPIDRSRATPLTTILPMDVLRSTLGVGPCQYILDAEGLGGDDPAPPDTVLAWIERLVKKKRAARSAEEIKERLDAMVAHLAAARQRIDDYAAFGRQVRHVCRQAKNEADAEAEDAKAVLAICDRLDHDVERGRRGMRTHEDAAKLARQVISLIEKADALAEFESPAKALRAIGAAHDATLARSRMAARRMKATCRGSKSNLARKVETMAERMLRPSK